MYTTDLNHIHEGLIIYMIIQERSEQLESQERRLDQIKFKPSVRGGKRSSRRLSGSPSPPPPPSLQVAVADVSALYYCTSCIVTILIICMYHRFQLVSSTPLMAYLVQQPSLQIIRNTRYVTIQS